MDQDRKSRTQNNEKGCPCAGSKEDRIEELEATHSDLPFHSCELRGLTCRACLDFPETCSLVLKNQRDGNVPCTVFFSLVWPGVWHTATASTICDTETVASLGHKGGL